MSKFDHFLNTFTGLAFFIGALILAVWLVR